MLANQPEKKIIVISGGSSGIGKELALQLSAKGSKIYIIGQNNDRLNEVKAACESKGAETISINLDATDEETSISFIDNCLKENGKIDEFYDCAVKPIAGEISELNNANWTWVLDQALYSSIFWISHVYQKMVLQRSGKIIIFSSLAGITSYPTFSGYGAAKSALIAFFKSIQSEAKKHCVDVRIVCPGYIKTNIFKNTHYVSTSYEKYQKIILLKSIPVDKATKLLLDKIKKGNRFIIFPFYAKLINFFSYASPWVISFLHKETLQSYRNLKKDNRHEPPE